MLRRQRALESRQSQSDSDVLEPQDDLHSITARFGSHCRVGTGHSDAERKAIENHLAGNLQVRQPLPVFA
jgi:hypothetical protein